MAAFILYLLCRITDMPLKNGGHRKAAGASLFFGMRSANDSALQYMPCHLLGQTSLKELTNIVVQQQLDPVHVAVAVGCAACLTAACMQLLPRWPAFEEATECSTSQVMPQLEVCDIVRLAALPGISEERSL